MGMLQCIQFIKLESPPESYSVGRPEDTVSQDDKECPGQRGISIAEKLRSGCPLEGHVMAGATSVGLCSLRTTGMGGAKIITEARWEQSLQ